MSKTDEEVIKRLQASPFRPFRIVTTSGRAYEVSSPDHAAVLSLSRTIVVESDDLSSVDIPPLHVSAVEPLPRRRRRAGE